MTKNGKNDWRPVTTTDVSLATTDSVLTTTGDHWQPLTTTDNRLNGTDVG